MPTRHPIAACSPVPVLRVACCSIATLQSVGRSIGPARPGAGRAGQNPLSGTPAAPAWSRRPVSIAHVPVWRSSSSVAVAAAHIHIENAPRFLEM
eukprot:scaffold5452_cov127-Isochrysis_galbana.AAC.3